CRWEAHIWIKDLGRQVYLGGYEHEEHAAEAYDVAALKTKGLKSKTNFPQSRYEALVGCIDSISVDEIIMAVRRQSQVSGICKSHQRRRSSITTACDCQAGAMTSWAACAQGFSRGTSSFRGVTAHPSGRWESRIGIPQSKHVYLGLFDDEREAALAYDRALVRLRGTAAATNFGLAQYNRELAEFNWVQDPVNAAREDVKVTMSLGPDFERWVKHGSSVFPHMAVAVAGWDEAPAAP
ncbi:AP2-domain-containing protein, partial [Haematococcus lacustris]